MCFFTILFSRSSVNFAPRFVYLDVLLVRSRPKVWGCRMVCLLKSHIITQYRQTLADIYILRDLIQKIIPWKTEEGTRQDFLAIHLVVVGIISPADLLESFNWANANTWDAKN